MSKWKIKTVSVPTLFLSGTLDQLIPSRMMMELYQVSTQWIMPPSACSTQQGREGRGGEEEEKGGRGKGGGGEERMRGGREEEGREGRRGKGREEEGKGGGGEGGRVGYYMCAQVVLYRLTAAASPHLQLAHMTYVERVFAYHSITNSLLCGDDHNVGAYSEQLSWAGHWLRILRMPFLTKMPSLRS